MSNASMSIGVQHSYDRLQVILAGVTSFGGRCCEDKCVHGGNGQGTRVISTVEPFLIRGLDAACGAFVVGVPRSDPRRSAMPLHIWAEDPLTDADAWSPRRIFLRLGQVMAAFGSICCPPK